MFSKKLPAALVIIAVGIFLYIPVAILVVNSFNADKYGISWGGFTLDWYYKLFANYNTTNAAIHSIVVAFAASTLATIIGALAAINIFRYKNRINRGINLFLTISLISPDIVMAISLLVLFVLLGIKLGFVSLLLSHIAFCIPFVVIVVSSRLAGFNNSMLEAAKDLGASELVIIRKIIIPIIMPSVAAGWLLAFTVSLDDVIVSSFVSGSDFEVLPVRVFSLVKTGVTPEINSLATLMIVLSFALLLLVTAINLYSQRKLHDKHS